jgi:WD40 repeat protein/tRNA A-37 threonylcarbamoyl transferase component Bud32
VSSENRCRECGGVIPSGSPGDLCAKCLLGLALAPGQRVSDAPPPAEPPAAALPPNQTQVVSLALTEQLGDQIGRYKLLEKIGEGGFGAVYVAEQQEPVKRRVALKIIKLGMDTRQVVARFEAERQALARMEHPNIAQIFDASATNTGRPYFVMELVRGIPITRYCDANHLPPQQRLELFTQVCRAIQHAHQKGVIHRDIKPSNILVTLHDGVPVPKVIDFGIAKATQGDLTDKTIYTQFEQFIGTPAYMSPEQAEMSGLDLDTRSDIYSLGVLLYELLVGRTPFDSKELVAAGLDAMRRTIREEEPVRPSTRLRGMGREELTTMAERRGAEAPRLISWLRGDLDWIVMKCLEKDRARRYEAAIGLAADIQRHLDNEPVAARPPSTAYKLQKFVRRNKVMVTAAGLIGTALVLGVVVSTWQAVRATKAEGEQSRERQRAEANEQKAQRAEEHARLEAHAAREQLLRLTVANGVRLEDQGDSTGALLWFAQSLGLVEGDPDQERVHRLRYASVLQHCPRLLHVLSHTNGLSYAVFSPDGKSILTIGYDARVWDAATGRPTTPALYHVPTWGPFTGAFSPDGSRVVAGGGETNSVRVYDARTGQPLTPPLRTGNWVFHTTFSPDGRRVAAGGWDTNVWVWDASTGVVATTLRGHTGVVTQASFSPDGGRLLTASFDGTARLWDAASGMELHRLRHAAAVRNAVFSTNGRFIATASVDRTARVWDAATDEPLGQPLNHAKAVYQVCFSPDGRRLLTGGLDHGRIWDLATGQSSPFKHFCTILSGWPRFPLLSPDGRFVIAAGTDHSACVYDARTLLPITPPLPHNGQVSYAAFSPDSRRILTASGDGMARVWDLSPKAARSPPSQPPSLLSRVAFSTDRRRFAMAAGNNAARLVDALTGQPIGPPLQHSGTVLCACFSPDGHWVATAGLDPVVRVWDAATGLPAGPALKQTDWVSFVCFAPESRRVCAVAGQPLQMGDASTGQRLQIWDLITGRPTTSPMEHNALIEHASFSSDGRQLVSAGSDGMARVWNAQTGQAVTPFFRHEQPVFHAAFSQDGRLVVTASADRTARVWDAKTGELVLVPLEHRSAVRAAAFNAAGTRILTLTEEGIWAWDLPSDSRPLEDLSLHATVLAGRRLDATGSFQDMTASETGEGWQRLCARHPARPYPAERLGPSLLASDDPEAARFLAALGLTRPSMSPEPAPSPFCVDVSTACHLALDSELPNMLRGGSLPSLPQGRQKVGQTEFEIRPGVVQFAGQYLKVMGKDFPSQFLGLKVGRRCRVLHFLHARRWGAQQELLVRYVINFANGQTWEIPLTLQDLDNVSFTGDQPVTAKGSIVAWSGTNSLGQVRLYQTSWENPLPQVEVDSIDLVSGMPFYPSFLVAITVE